MEADLQILKGEYLSNLGQTEILNLSLDDQRIFCKSLKWREPPMTHNLQIIKIGISQLPHFESNSRTNHIFQSLNEEDMSLDDQTVFYKNC